MAWIDTFKKFSTDDWKKISSEEKEFHSLSNCRQCATEHLDFQKSFPSLPIFEMAESQPNIIEFNLPSTSGTSGGSRGWQGHPNLIFLIDLKRMASLFTKDTVVIVTMLLQTLLVVLSC